VHSKIGIGYERSGSIKRRVKFQTLFAVCWWFFPKVWRHEVIKRKTCPSIHWARSQKPPLAKEIFGSFSEGRKLKTCQFWTTKGK
jgi:hypothetical protein